MKAPLEKSFSIILSAACLGFLLLAHNAQALVLYWDPNGTTSVGGNGTWNTTTLEWSGASTQSSSLLAWPATGILGGTNCAACFCAGPTGTANQGTFTVTVTNSINMGGIFNGDLNPGPCTITINATGAGSLSLLNALCAFETYNGSTIINAPITGPGALNAEGSGELYLNASNSYTGGTAFGNNEGSPAFSGIIYYNNNNSFGTGVIAVTNTGGLIGALLEETGASGVVISNAWKITPAIGGINLALTDPSAVVTFSGAWTLTSNLNIGTGGTAQNNLVTISGVMSGVGALSKFNPNTLRLSGANTYTGNTTVSNGTLQLGANGGIPSGSGKGSVTVTNPGILDVNGFSGSVNGLGGNGTIDNTSASTGTLSIGNNNVSSTFSGVIQNTGGPLNITKAGTGTLTLGTTATGYSGNTTISAGTLALGSGGGVIPAASPVILTTGATLNMAGNSDAFAALSGGGSVTNNTGTITLDGNISTNNYAAYSCFFGSIDQGTLTKSGTHVMSLRQTNLYNPGAAFSYQGGVLSVGAGPNRLPPTYALSVPTGGLFQLDANSQTVSSLNGSGAINLGGGTLTVNATSGSYYSGSIQNSELITNSTAAGHGLRGYYYGNNDFSDLVTVRDDAEVNFTNLTLPVNLPSPPYPKTNYISIRWLGQIQTTVAGTYTFTVTSDDGQRLWVNGTNLVDDWVSESATAKSGNITLAANTRYDIVMEYMNITGAASTMLAWTPPGDSVSTVIPTDYLYLPGAGSLVVSGSSQVTLAASNSYTGGTTVSSTGTLEASGDNTLGQGNVYVDNGGSLTLDNGVTNGYISTNGDLVINGAGVLLNLSYPGTNSIHGLSTNGGTNYMPLGTYGASGSGAAYQITQAIGTGILNVTASPSTNTLTSSSGTSVYGSSVTFTSTISGSGPTPTGTLTLYDGASAIGMATLSGGQAVFTVSDLQAITSPHSISAVYNGDSTHAQSTSSPLIQTVNALGVSATNLSASNRVYNATASASFGGGTLVGVLTNDTNNVRISSATATFSDKNIGTNKTVTVTNFVLAGSLAGDYTVSPGSTTTTANISNAVLTVANITAINEVYNGTTNISLSTGGATLTGVISGDSVTLNTGGAAGSVATAGVGTNKAVTITGLSVSGTDSGNYALIQPGTTVTISQASTTNSVGSTANPSAPGAAVMFSSTPTPVAPGAGTLTGSVIFLTNNVAFSTNSLSGGSTFSASTTNLPVGINAITAEYLGDANFTGSTNILSQVVGSTPPGALSASLVGTNVVLNWSGSFTLQSAVAANGTNNFSDVPGPVLTGPYTNTNAAMNLFFRLRN